MSRKKIKLKQDNTKGDNTKKFKCLLFFREIIFYMFQIQQSVSIAKFSFSIPVLFLMPVVLFSISESNATVLAPYWIEQNSM